MALQVHTLPADLDVEHISACMLENGYLLATYFKGRVEGDFYDRVMIEEIF